MENDDNQQQKPSSTATNDDETTKLHTPTHSHVEDLERSGSSTSRSSNFSKFYEELNAFLATLSAIKESEEKEQNPPDVPDSVERFVKVFKDEVAKCEISKDHGRWCSDLDEGSALLEALGKVSQLTQAISRFPSDYAPLRDRSGSILQRSLVFLEEEFRWFLEDSQRRDGQQSHQETEEGDASFPGFSPDAVARLSMIAHAMIGAGSETECCQVFSIARRTCIEWHLGQIGFGKTCTNEIQRLQWECMEKEIATWIKTCQRCIDVYFSGERRFCEAVFNNHPSISCCLFGNLARCVVIQLLNFSEVVAKTQRSAERLFKFVDMYEALRDLAPAVEDFPELKSETSCARGRLGEAALSMFVDLENSIRSDHAKTPVPGGAVHPLTRYVMNYLKYACEYKDTLEQVFRELQGSGKYKPTPKTELENEENAELSPFRLQLMAAVDLLNANLDLKSKLYKDHSLTCIFMLNNAQYIMKKIKGTAEMHAMFGDSWRRKQSAELRQFHKNYQRETWSKILGCFREEGLQQGRGNVSKMALKERFKTFNSMFDEIHKTQSTWVVSDEQLQSELRVSIAAVVIPAYRSFLARYRQFLEGSRQADKYIKYQPEDLETHIDELFDGNHASIGRRKI
ncbi:hypothetical protein ACLOJK_002160 [Asimina triloba]